MTLNKNKIGAIILAAGKGKRMKSDKLKVMHKLGGRPLIEYAINALSLINLSIKPVVVVCTEDSSVQDYLGDRVEYVVQEERLGTGHAVRICESTIKNNADHVIVLYGDMPFFKPNSIKNLVEKHLERGDIITLATSTVSDYNGVNAPLNDYGRIIRDESGSISKIAEKKDLLPEQENIKETNIGCYCFSCDWLWVNIKKLDNNNAQGEYYLTDLIKIAIDDNQKISSINIDPKEALGINTKEDLELAHKYI